MCKYILAIVLILSVFVSSAQFQNAVPQVNPVSPDAAAMFKVLERPLGSFTGTVPVNFPLCSLSSGGLTASVSLNYNSTGGIRLEEAPGSMGLGFLPSEGRAPQAKRLVKTNQEVNPNITGAIDSYYGKPGQNILHEVIESYEGGKISQSTLTSSPAGGQPGSVYQAAHNAAPLQAGPIYQTNYDSQGNAVTGYSGAVRAEFSVQEGTRLPLIILKYP